MRRSRRKRDAGMLAIDTNIIVRYLVGDDPNQARRAKALVDGAAVFVATTTLLEAEWVLRRAVGYATADTLAALKAFVGLDNVTLEDEALVAQAFDWAERGMDFADALHLAKTADCEAFISFDRNLAKAARRFGAIAVKEP
ncbi:MAG TPA: type II toxin-antitoxin system VapC family toxin [Roseiarcus sp.]|nr:type II toxin-antitoxin system VapC family toxin [Roseiarcus sp.]